MSDKTWNAATLGSKRVLVTGAAGFIGSALCRALVQAGAEVHGTSRIQRDADGSVHWWQADLSSPEPITSILRKIQPGVIFHLASHVDGDRTLSAVHTTIRDNLLTTVNLLTAACQTGHPRVVLAGSMEEGDADAIPVTPYAAAKSAASTYARLFHGLYGLPVVHLRVFMVYGPGQEDIKKLIPYVTTSLLKGDEPKLSSGTREIDWVYVEDVVAAFVAAAESPETYGQSIDIGSGELITVRLLVNRIVELIGGSAKPLFGALEDRPLEHRRAADVNRAWRAIGWKPYTPLNTGLEQTVRWFRARYENEAERR